MGAQDQLDRLLRTLPDLQMARLRDEADGVFGCAVRPCIIYADPPWTYASSDVHVSAAARHYDTMSDEQLAALPVAGLAGEDCALLLWATFPRLQSALRVMAAWGFEYRTVFIVWVKVQRYMARLQAKTGTYTRPNAELVLLGMRGNMTPASRTGINRCNVLLARPREHSRKPDVVRQIAVELFGDYPRIELFARHPGPPPDWSAWGNELAGARSARDLRTEAAGSPSDQVDAGGDDDDDDDDGFDLAAKQATKRRRYRPYIPLAPTYEMLESFEPFATQSAQQFVEPDNLEPIVPAVKVNRLDYFFALETASPVHANYAPLTEQAVADNIDYIHNRQRQHADALFKFNYGRR
jgi:N6-adenosine-specific RNA methylase IME4